MDYKQSDFVSSSSSLDFYVRRLEPKDSELIRQIPGIYLATWDNGYGIGYPPRERLKAEYMENWVSDSDRECYVAVDREEVIGVMLNALDRKDGIVEGCGWAVKPNIQRRGVGRALVERSLGRGSGYMGNGWRREVGANYVSIGSQRLSESIGLVPSAVVPWMYNNIPESYSNGLGISNGEVIMVEPFLGELLLGDQNLGRVMEQLGFRVRIVKPERRLKDLNVKEKVDDFNGVVSLSVSEKGKSLWKALEEKPKYANIVRVGIGDLDVQELLGRALLPAGIVYDKAWYYMLPEGKSLPDFCENEKCKGSESMHGIAKAHSPFPNVRKAFEEQKSLWRELKSL